MGLFAVANVEPREKDLTTGKQEALQIANHKDTIVTAALQHDPNSHIIVHGRDGPYVMNKNKWPNLTLSEEMPMEGLTQEDSLIANQAQGGTFSKLGSMARVPGETSEKEDGIIYVEDDEDIMDPFSNLEGNLKWLSPKSRKTKKKKGSKQVIVVTRASSRIPKDGRTITEKATSRAMAKNSITGNIPKTSNPFTILNSSEVSSLHNVLDGLNIVVSDVEEQIGVLRLS